MQFTYTLGGALPATQPISVECVDCATRLIPSGPIQATLNKNAAWLTLDKLSGTTPFQSNISVSPAGLSAGTYNATIGVASTSEPICNPLAVTMVSLVVSPAPLPPVIRAPIVINETVTLKLAVLGPPSALPTVNFKTLNDSSFKVNNKEFDVLQTNAVRVELYVDDALVGVQATRSSGKLPATVQLQWMESVIPVGTYTLKAIAYNATGAKASATITVRRTS